MTKRKPRDPDLLLKWMKTNIVRDADGKFKLVPPLDTRLALLRTYAVMCWQADTQHLVKRRPWPVPKMNIAAWMNNDLDELERLCLLPGMGKE